MKRVDEKFVLINSNRIKPAIAPVALDYLAQALKEKGYDVDLLDLCFSQNWRREIDRYLQKTEALAFGLTIRNIDDAYFASQGFFMSEIKKIVDHLGVRSQAPIILGGVGFSTAPEEIMGYCEVDFGIWGEGELSLPALLGRITSGEEPSDVPGVIFRRGDGFLRNPPEYMDLSHLPSQRRWFVDNGRYFVEGGQGGIEMKRGCDRLCIYCADPVAKGRKVRTRPPGHVVDEIEALLKMGVNCLHTCDSEFNIPQRHAIEICEEILRRGVQDKVSWYAYASPKPFSEGLARLMVRAGCVGIDFGVDSGCDGQLERLGRDFTEEEIREAARLCRKYGLIFMFDLLLGGPGETRGTMKRTIELMNEIKPDRVGASFGVRIYPGTRLAAMVLEEGPIEDNPNLKGRVEGNGDFLAPIFYVSSELGESPDEYLAELIVGDRRFFFATKQDLDANYNYNQNLALVDAIKRGYRGAYWDILRRLQEGS